MKNTRVEFRLILMTILILLIDSCSGGPTSERSDNIAKTASSRLPFVFSKGADVSWLPQMEATGYRFYDADGAQKNCLQLLKDRGMNTIRLRVWVNPSNDKINGHCSVDETVVMAVRAKIM